MLRVWELPLAKVRKTNRFEIFVDEREMNT